MRTRQKLRLARYARQSVLQWDAVPVSEFEAYHEALNELIEQENESIPNEDS